MQEDITELRNLPLEQLISAPLISVIKAQAQAATTTAKFVEEIGFKKENEDKSMFDTPDGEDNNYDVRVAKLRVTTTGGAADTTNVTTVELPFISLVNVPNFEITNFDWAFNVKLKSMQSFSAKFGIENTTTTTGDVNAGLDIKGILKIGGGMKVESCTKTDFESRYKSGREQEYNLAISVKGTQAPLPKGIETLLSIAEAAAKASTAPSPPPG